MFKPTLNYFKTASNEYLGVFFGQYALTSLDALRPNGTRYIPENQRDNYAVVDMQYGPVVIDRATKRAVLSASDDKIIMGNPQPKFTLTFLNNFTIFKNLNINVQIDWWSGGQIYNQTRQWLYRDRVSKDFDLPFNIPANTQGQGAASGAFVSTYNSLYNSVFPLNWFVENGSFVRLRDLSISYNLSSIAKQNWLKNATITLSGRNLFTITKYRGLDPEAVSAGIATPVTTNSGDNTTNSSNALGVGPARGVDSFSFPNLRSLQAGITIGF